MAAIAAARSLLAVQPRISLSTARTYSGASRTRTFSGAAAHFAKAGRFSAGTGGGSLFAVGLAAGAAAGGANPFDMF